MVSAGRIGTKMAFPGGRARNIWDSYVDVPDRPDKPKQLLRKPDGRRVVSQLRQGTFKQLRTYFCSLYLIPGGCHT